MYANPASAARTARSVVTVPRLRRMKAEGERIAALTAYDASFARVLDGAGVDLVLVGDSLGMVVQGHASTLPVTVEDIVYHTACVARGIVSALLVADMPFQSYATPGARARRRAAMLARGGASWSSWKAPAPCWNRPVPRRARHPGLRAPWPDAAVGAAPGWLPGAGSGRGGGEIAGRCPGRGRRRRRPAGARVRADAARDGDQQGHRHSDHRHRRGSGLRRPGAGVARPARHQLRPPPAAFRQGFPRRRRFHRRRDQGLRASGQERRVSRRRTRLRG